MKQIDCFFEYELIDTLWDKLCNKITKKTVNKLRDKLIYPLSDVLWFEIGRKLNE